MPTLASGTSNDPEDNVVAIKEQVSQTGSGVQAKSGNQDGNWGGIEQKSKDTVKTMT